MGSFSHLESWALELAAKKPHNPAAVALADKMVRVCWAVWYHGRAFEKNPLKRAA